MAYADFNEDYRNRTSGLSAWLQSLAAPSTPTQPAGVAGPVASPVDFGSQNPNDKAISLAQEAFQPGSAEIHQSREAAPEQPFRDSTMGQIIGGMMPNTVGRVFEQQRGKALADYAQNMPTDPLEAIQGLMSIDPRNAQQYIPELMAAAAKEPELKRQKDLQAYLKSLSDQGGISAPHAAAAAPDFGAPSHEFDTGLATPPPAVDAGAMTPFPGFKDPAPQPASAAVNSVMGGPGLPPQLPSTALQMFNQAQPSDMPADKYPAQTYQESHGDPNAISPKGAMGLKQLMPATAANPGFGIAPAKDGSVAENMRVGNEYMDAMLQKYNGNVPLALAGYNWGPHATDKWISEGSDPAKLPPETVDYINKVGPAIEAQIAGKKQPSPLAAFNQQLTPEEGMALKMAAIDPKYADNALAAFGKRFQATPYTDQGKVAADVKNGFLSPEQAAVKAAQGSVITPENQNLQGEDFIKTLPDPAVQNMTRAMLRGDAPYPNITSRTPSVVKQALEAAQQADPTYSAATAPVRKATKIAFATGPEARNVNALNTLINHLGEMQDNDKNLPSHSIDLLNAAQNAIVPHLSDEANSALNNYNIDKTGVGSEAAKAYKGVGAVSLEEQKDWQKNLSANNGPETRAQARQEIARLVAGKINALESQWSTAFPNEPKTFISEKAKKALVKLGVNVDDFTAAPDTAAPPAAPDIADLQAAAAAELAKRKGG